MKHSYYLPGIRATADLMQMDQGPGDWLVTRIEVAENLRGRGFARQLLQLVCDDADREQVSLSLVVCPDLSPRSLTWNQLYEWYERYGFQAYAGPNGAEDWDCMVRFPAKNTRLDSPSED